MTTTNLAERVLTAQDRCDSCSAEAKVVATFISGELLFCGHHARAVKENLTLKAVSLFDPHKELGLL